MGFLSSEPSQNALDRSKSWENGSFYGLAGAYAFIAFVAIVQLCRIQMRVPEYGWTTQKVFHLLNFVVMGVRAVVFFLRREVQSLRPLILQAVVLDLPGLLFFSTYSLLVLFWAEIYHQARSVSTDRLRPAFLIVNSIVYLIQIIIWLFYWRSPTALVGKISNFFFAGVSLLAAMGFILYGGRLFLMLRRFPIESKGRQKKLWEVGCVTAICFACFAIRSFFLAFSAVDKKAELDVLYHPLLNVIYYLVVEILPSALVLFILRKLPPKRTNQYHPIPLA